MIKVTEEAKVKIIQILDEHKATALRFGLQGGGCSGMQYFFAVNRETEEDDIIIPLDETYSVVIDYMSLGYLEDAELGYTKDLMSEHFTVNNPQAKKSCGCGSSFSID